MGEHAPADDPAPGRQVVRRRRGYLWLAASLVALEAVAAVAYRMRRPRPLAPVATAAPVASAAPSPARAASAPAPFDRVVTDLSSIPANEKAFVRAIRRAADLVDASPAIDVAALAIELRRGADALDDREPALKGYLSAVIDALASDAWGPADASWMKLDASTSRYYLRVEPEDARPDGKRYHLTFGTFDREWLAWEARIDPSSLTRSVWSLLGFGKEWKAPASFPSAKLPDVVAVALEAGSSRPSIEPLARPPFGPSAAAASTPSRAVVKILRDVDRGTAAAERRRASAIFCADTLAAWSDEPFADVAGAILYAAAGDVRPALPRSERVSRKPLTGGLRDAIGELRTRSIADHLVGALEHQRVVDGAQAERILVRSVFGTFARIARTRSDDELLQNGVARAAAFQAAFWTRDLGVCAISPGAMSWRSTERAANGQDVGCFTVRRSSSTFHLALAAADIEARSDKARAEDFLERRNIVVARPDPIDPKALRDVVRTRMNREPSLPLAYEIRLD